MAQPSRPKAPELTNPTWVAANQHGGSSPPFAGHNPMENWFLQKTRSEPWNAVGVVAGPMDGLPLVRQETARDEKSSTRATVGSPPTSPSRG